MQFAADLLRANVRVNAVEELSALGAVYGVVWGLDCGRTGMKSAVWETIAVFIIQNARRTEQASVCGMAGCGQYADSKRGVAISG